MPLSGKTFLVTGATGRLGRDVVARLEELGATPLPLVLRRYPLRPKLVAWNARTEPIEANDLDDLAALPRPDYAIHLHWRVDRSKSFAEQVGDELNWNVHEQNFLWEWLREQAIERFLNCSTIRVFSHRNENPISADTEPHPATPYGIAKLAAEHFFSNAFDDARTQVAHVRLGSVFSAGEHPSQLINQLLSSALDGERCTVNTEHTANIMYIDDAVDMLIYAAANARSGRYLAVNDAVPIDDIATLVEKATGKALTADYVNLAPGARDPVFVSDNEKLRGEWSRVTSLEDGIRDVIRQRNQ